MEGDVFKEVAEDLVLSNEVSFAINFYQNSNFSLKVDVGSNRSLFCLTRGFRSCSCDPFDPEKLLGLLEIPTGLGKGFFAVHHACIGFIAEFFDEFG